MPRLFYDLVIRKQLLNRSFIKKGKKIDIKNENNYTIKSLIHASCSALKYENKSKTLKLK